MWLSSRLSELLSLNVEASRANHEDLAVLRAENALLKSQLAVAQNSFEWVRTRVNQLEMERAGLMEKAYHIHLPAPEIVRTDRDLMNRPMNIADLFETLPLDDDDV